jgi:putative spermidine/putrescine transport system ATP-binding protein
MSALLELQGLRLSMQGRPLLDVERLQVREGELLVVLGPTGAGKSTLLRVMNRLQKPDHGIMKWQGEPVPWPAPLPLRRRIAMAFQDPLLFAGTVADNVGYGLRLRKLSSAEIRSRTGELLEMMGLAGLADRRADRLSGGEAQRAALARALAVRPQLLLLDEPLANLDAPIRERIAHDLQQALRSLGIACVFVTHHQREAMALGDRLAILHEGRIQQTGSAEDVFRRPCTAFVARFVRTLNVLPGTVEPGRFRCRSGPLLTIPLGHPAGPGHLCLRPEEVRLQAVESSEANRFRVTVESLRDQGSTLQVELTGDLSLRALLTHREARELGLRAGLELWARLPIDALHLIPDAVRGSEG